MRRRTGVDGAVLMGASLPSLVEGGGVDVVVVVDVRALGEDEPDALVVC